MSTSTDNDIFRKNMLDEIKKIQNELNELKNIRKTATKKKVAKRKPARKTAAKKKVAKRKPARTNKSKRKARR